MATRTRKDWTADKFPRQFIFQWWGDDAGEVVLSRTVGDAVEFAQHLKHDLGLGHVVVVAVHGPLQFCAV